MEIDIQIEDEKLFTDVALVVDQEEFLEEVKKLRKTYGIDKPWPYEQYREFYRDIYNTPKRIKLEKVIENVRKKLNLPHTFIRVIEKSVFCGAVNENDYYPAILTKYTKDRTGYDEYCIILSPEARDEDVIRALWEYRDEVKNYLGHNLKGYKFIPVSRNQLVKGKPSIKDHRQWYFDVESGLPVDKIHRNCVDNCPIHNKVDYDKSNKRPPGCTCFSLSTIRKGVDNYKSLLWKSRTV